MTVCINRTASRIKALALVAILACFASTAFAGTTASNTATEYSHTTAGTAITNSATVTFTGAPSTLTSNEVTVYVNQIDSFYITNNDEDLTSVAAAQQAYAYAGQTGVSFSYTITNVSNGKVELNLGLSSSSTYTMSPIVSGVSTYGTPTVTFTTSSSGCSITGSQLTIDAPSSTASGVACDVKMSFTAPTSSELLLLGVTDATTTASTNYVVHQYVSGATGTVWSGSNTPSSTTGADYSYLETHVTNEVDIVGGLEVYKQQLLDTNCNLATFETSSPSWGTITWPTTIPSNGYTGVTASAANVDIKANPGECIVYRVSVKNPLSASVSGVVITDAAPSNTTANGNAYYSTSDAFSSSNTDASFFSSGHTFTTLTTGEVEFVEFEVKVN